ncbi:hypothetical protein U1Q18_044547 [Sarracenia purpurea var. burkii]
MSLNQLLLDSFMIQLQSFRLQSKNRRMLLNRQIQKQPGRNSEISSSDLEDPVTFAVRSNQSFSPSCATSAVKSNKSSKLEMSIHDKFVVKFVLDFDDFLIFDD